jgi:small GTP-binding protein
MIKRTKFNVSILGESSVGKTSMINSLKGYEFDPNQIATIGVDDFIDEAKFENKEYKFKIFDTAGQERYKCISTNTIQIADGFLIVFSVTDRKSFELLDNWINNINESVDIKSKILILAGNKADIDDDKREVSREEAESYAKSNNLPYFETSAKSGLNIKEVFNKLYEDIFNLNKKIIDKKNIELIKEDKNKNRKKRKC